MKSHPKIIDRIIETIGDASQYVSPVISGPMAIALDRKLG